MDEDRKMIFFVGCKPLEEVSDLKNFLHRKDAFLYMITDRPASFEEESDVNILNDLYDIGFGKVD